MSRRNATSMPGEMPGAVIAFPGGRRSERVATASPDTGDSPWPDVALLLFMLAVSGLTFGAALLQLGHWTAGGLGLATALALWAARQLVVQLRAIRRPGAAGSAAARPGGNGS